MALTLVITNVQKLDNGVSTTLMLDRNGAVIGRSAVADWSLPDPHSYISSTHCEIDYRDGDYLITDRSLNGTLVNGGPDRLGGPHRISNGDVITIGHYEISCQLGGAGQAAAAANAAAPEAAPAWNGWDRGVGGAPAETGASGWGSGQNAPANAQPGSSVWAATPEAAAPASPWSSPVAQNAASRTPAANIWAQLTDSNVVDWARGGFGADSRAVPDLGMQNPAGAPVTGGKDPFGLGPPVAAVPQPAAGWGAAPAAAAAQSPPPPPARSIAAASVAVPTPAAPLSPAAQDAWAAFVAEAGIDAAEIKVPPQEAMAAAGALMRRLVAGMVVLLEARARAKAQLGAQGTSLEFDGNNPLKFARSPERAIAQILNPPERGFMPADRAIEDSFRDLQAHQMATLAAMQGALAATLARFSPEAIRERAETNGILAKILPAAREAELWKAYEREFEGVSRGSDEAFMDVFAKEFRAAYERTSAEMKSRR